MVQIIFVKDGDVASHLNTNRIQQVENPANITLAGMNLVQNTGFGLNVGHAAEGLGSRKDVAMTIIKEYLRKTIIFYA